MRFTETKNVSYECVYDNVTHEEHMDMYSMLPVMNELAKRLYNAEKLIAESVVVLDTEPNGVMRNMNNLEGRSIWYPHKDKYLRDVIKYNQEKPNDET